MSSASVIGIFDCGLDSFFAADTKYTFIVCLDSIITLQIIPYSSIPLIWTVYMDFLNHLCNAFIFCFILRNISVKPFIICCTAYMT